jgi:SAM-dependent methyltransferase
MACLRPGERVLDVASGPGDSALLLAREFGATVRGIDLAPPLVDTATSIAAELGLSMDVRFEIGDAERLRTGAVHDVVLCECALCTFSDKRRAVEGFRRALAPGGRLCLSDVVVDRAKLPVELLGTAGHIACVADALPIDGYLRLLEVSGLRVCWVEQHDEAVLEMAERIDARLAFVAAVGLEAVAGLDVARARATARAAAAAARDGALGYVLIMAELDGIDPEREVA